MPLLSRIGATVVAIALGAATTFARTDTVLVLTNGREIVVERFWERGAQIYYELNGSTFGFPRSMLARVDGTDANGGARAPAPTSGYRNDIASETIAEARAAAHEEDYARAARLYRRAIARAPDAIEVRIELADLYLRMRDYRRAESELERARAIAPRHTGVLERLGDAYYGLGRTGLAIREWQLALAERSSPGLLYKLKRALEENDDDIYFDAPEMPRFVIRYEGEVDVAVGRLIATALDEEFAALESEFRFTPSGSIEVTLYTGQEFDEVSQPPSWASGLNDGRIRIPVESAAEVTPRLRRVVRHELAHSFIMGLTLGNCPTWLHEGIAQYVEGTDRLDPYPRLRAAQGAGGLVPLWNLEGALTGLSKEDALLVYSEALAAIEYLVARRGREAPFAVLRRLGENDSIDEALRTVVGLDYREFQTAWEADLARGHAPSR